VSQSILDREPLIQVWRPLYHRILAPYIWPLIGYSSHASPVASVSAVSAVQDPPQVAARDQTEVNEALMRIERRQGEILDRLARLEGCSLLDWTRLEQLLLCLWTDPSFPAPRAFEELRNKDER
jgi:hypothetical protein